MDNEKERVFEVKDFVLYYNYENKHSYEPITKFMYMIKSIAVDFYNRDNVYVTIRNIMTGNYYTLKWEDFVREINREEIPDIKSNYIFQKCDVFGNVIEE